MHKNLVFVETAAQTTKVSWDQIISSQSGVLADSQNHKMATWKSTLNQSWTSTRKINPKSELPSGAY